MAYTMLGGIVRNFVQTFCKLTGTEIIFILLVLLTEFGCNLTLDLPGALQNSLMKNYSLSASQFSLFYSLYYIPSALLNGFSGFLIDNLLGIRMSTFLYGIIGMIGCALFSIGGVVDLFWLMLMGRLVFGLGNEMTTGVCVNYCIFKWYSHSIVNLISSLYSNSALLGTLLMYQLCPRLVDLLSQSKPEKEALNIVVIIVSCTFIITTVVAVLMTFMKPKIDENEDILSSIPASMEFEQEKKASLRDILQFPAIFWLLCFINVINCLLGSFLQFSQGLLTSSEFSLTIDQAGNAISIMNGIMIALSIPISMSVDLVGRNVGYVFTAQILGVMAYSLLILKLNPFFCMPLLGLSITIFTSAIMPMYAYPLEKHLVGTCYGLVSTVSGLGLTLGPIIIGQIIDTYGYIASLYFYAVSSAVNMVCVFIVWILDKRRTGVLNMSPNQRRALAEKNRVSIAQENNKDGIDNPEEVHHL